MTLLTAVEVRKLIKKFSVKYWIRIISAIETYYVDRNTKDSSGQYTMTFKVDAVQQDGDNGFVDGEFQVKKHSDNSIIDNGK